MPAPGTICEPDVPLFSNKTIMDAFGPIANFSKRSFDEDDEDEDEDDMSLLAAIIRLNAKAPLQFKALWNRL